MIHLTKRFLQSFDERELHDRDVARVHRLLSPAESSLWNRMCLSDRRHSLKVLDRFITFMPEATEGERVGVVLHDVGKIESDLGTFGRVLATVLGPRLERFRQYHDHEAIGARLLREVGSNQDAINILESRARPEVMTAFRLADHY